MKIQVNGKNTSDVSVLDRGLFYGDGLFETMRVKHGKIPLLSDHLSRFENSCARLYLKEPDIETLRSTIVSFCSDKDEGILKLIYTRGVGGRAYRLPDIEHPDCILILNDATTTLQDHYEKGISITICNTRLSRNPQLAGMKHLNKLEYVLAAAELKATSYQEALILDTNDNLIEGLTMNVFIVVDNILYTPNLSFSGVDGIMRNRLLNQAQALPLQYCIDDLMLTILDNADEIFLTNSIVGVLPVNAINNKIFGVGPITKQLQDYSHKILCYND